MPITTEAWSKAMQRVNLSLGAAASIQTGAKINKGVCVAPISSLESSSNWPLAAAINKQQEAAFNNKDKHNKYLACNSRSRYEFIGDINAVPTYGKAPSKPACKQI